jgi:protein-tyrosine phosphatase
VPAPNEIAIDAPGRLAIILRPRGGDWLRDDIISAHKHGVTIMVSLLTSAEVVELGLENEHRVATECGLEYYNCAIPDRSVPSDPGEFTEVARSLLEKVRGGAYVAIHCRMSIGRSALLAAALLILTGVSAEQALERVSAARGVPVPDTVRQRFWLTELAPRLG